MTLPTPTTTEIVTAAAHVCGVELSRMLSVARAPDLVRAREVTVCTLRQLGYSYPECARAMNRTHHSTCVTIYQRVASMPPADRKAIMALVDQTIGEARRMAREREPRRAGLTVGQEEAARRLLVDLEVSNTGPK